MSPLKPSSSSAKRLKNLTKALASSRALAALWAAAAFAVIVLSIHQEALSEAAVMAAVGGIVGWIIAKE